MSSLRAVPLGVLAGFATLLAALTATPGGAQTVLHACYVPRTGTVYRIKAAGTDETCKSDKHVHFSWVDAVGADHGALSGLADDDHPNYLLADGIRAATTGFAVTGTFGAGAIPTNGAGVRLMWYPGKAAFRAGHVDIDQWDDARIGAHSVAMGFGPTASGAAAVALGEATIASGPVSTALGFGSEATGSRSTALGNLTKASGSTATAFGSQTEATGFVATAMGILTIASGVQSTAMGSQTTASGNVSTSMGMRASTNGMRGSFAYGDGSTSNLPLAASLVQNTAPNQFMVRAAGGTIFYSNSELTAGVTLSPNAGAWASVSDVRRKTSFRIVDGESVLSKIAAMAIPEWSYKAQGSSVRHLGPTAQDFYAAFGLGESDTTITTIDADGVSLLAIKALEQRTRAFQADNEELRAQLEALRRELEALREVEVGTRESRVSNRHKRK